MARAPRALVAAALLALALAAARAAAGPRTGAQRSTAPAADAGAADALIDQLEVALRTAELIGDQRAELAAAARRRVRALYKLQRASAARLWFDPAERRDLARRRLAATWLVARDRGELGQLDQERGRAAAAELRLAGEILVAWIADVIAPGPPAAGSLARPVAGAAVEAGFGRYRRAGLELGRRGVELAAGPGRNVRAVDPGTVRFAGELSGLGRAIVVAHAGFVSITGRLARLEVARGDPVTRGQILGEAAGDRVYLELRLVRPGGGKPIDPAPLLAP